MPTELQSTEGLEKCFESLQHRGYTKQSIRGRGHEQSPEVSKRLMEARGPLPPLPSVGQNLPLYVADIGHEFDPFFRRFAKGALVGHSQVLVPVAASA